MLRLEQTRPDRLPYRHHPHRAGQRPRRTGPRRGRRHPKRRPVPAPQRRGDTGMSAPQQPDLKLKYSPWLVLVTLCLGFFMILLDTTIVNVAIPQLSDGLDAGLSDILWILNAYILT